MWWLVLACAPKEPDWVADCDCPNNQLCVWGGAAECVDVPDSCAAAFAGECDLSLVDDACSAAVCGFALGGSGGVAGSSSIAAECWTTDETATERWFDCDAPMTF